MMLSLFGGMFHRGDLKSWQELKKKRREEALANAQPWNEKQAWRPLVVVKAETYKPHSLFSVKPWDLASKGRLPTERGYFVESPHGEFRYVETLLPRGTLLTTWNSKGIGHVAFDGDVVIPALYERRMNGGETWQLSFRPDPWMSLTPAELWSLRIGTSMAKGHTVVAGLGLGWQLENVLKRKQVKKVTLVERSSELMQWLLPVVKHRVPRADWEKLHGVVGDAYEVVPKMTADVALIDIYPGWGGNHFDRCPSISKVWVWGQASAKGNDSLWSMSGSAPW